jgi:hypothetical protein
MPDLRPLDSSEMEMLFGWRALNPAPCAAKREGWRQMDNTVRDLLLIIFFGLAEAIMVWTLWNFIRSGRRRSSASSQFPTVNHQYKRPTT